VKQFRKFVAEETTSASSDGLPVVLVQPGVSSPWDKSVRCEINANLAEITETAFSWPLAGFEQICEVLSEHGLHVNTDLPGDAEEMDEVVYGILDSDKQEGTDGTPLFLYLFYEPTENGSQTEFYAEVVNENELDELLNDIDVNENDEDDEEELENDSGGSEDAYYGNTNTDDD
jgi:hypothetical protein